MTYHKLKHVPSGLYYKTMDDSPCLFATGSKFKRHTKYLLKRFFKDQDLYVFHVSPVTKLAAVRRGGCGKVLWNGEFYFVRARKEEFIDEVVEK